MEILLVDYLAELEGRQIQFLVLQVATVPKLTQAINYLDSLPQPLDEVYSSLRTTLIAIRYVKT